MPSPSYLYAFLARYFLWDSVVCLVHFEGFGFIVHGACALLGSSWDEAHRDISVLKGWVCLIVYLNTFVRPSFVFLSHSARLSETHALLRDPSSLITARDFYFGNCTCFVRAISFVIYVSVCDSIPGARHS